MIDEKRAFGELASALEPYLGDIVFVGGWAARLLSMHEHASPPAHAPLMTDDADVALPLDLRRREKDIHERLAAVGYTEQLRGSESPPIATYEKESFEVEFLTPQRGDGGRGGGGPRRERIVVAGAPAQALRYLDLLFVAPWTVTLTADAGYGVSRPTVVRVPNPVSFVIQKVLVLDRREPSKRAKDVLYVHDTAQAFGDALDQVRLDAARARAAVPERWFRTAQAKWTRAFAASSEVVAEAALIARDAGRAYPPSPSAIAAACTAFGAIIFGEPPAR